MFAPQFAVAQILKKAASLNAERALDLLDELSLSGWELTNAMHGYVMGAAPGGYWRETIGNLREYESERGLNRGSESLLPATQNMIAKEWIQEDFEEGIHWFTREIPRDFANPEDVKNVAATLWNFPAEERSRVVDWMENEQAQPHWDDQLILAYAPALLHSELDGNAGRLVGLISSEEKRVQFLTTLIGSTHPSDGVKLRYSPDSLNRLIEAARLTEGNAENFRNVIASGSWSPLKGK